MFLEKAEIKELIQLIDSVKKQPAQAETAHDTTYSNIELDSYKECIGKTIYHVPDKVHCTLGFHKRS